MTTQATTDDAAPLAVLSVSSVPFTRLIRVELRKMYDTRAGLWLLIAIGGITLVASVLFLIFARDDQLTFENFASIAGTPQGFLLPVLGILAITSEWSQRTGLTTFTLEPSRIRLLTAKLGAVLIMGVVAVVLLLSFAALGNALGKARGGLGTWDFGAAAFGDIVVVQMLGLLGGLAFGTVLLNSAAAITLSFVLPLTSNAAFNIIHGLSDVAPWIDASTAQQPLLDHSVSAHEWVQIGVTSAWWVWIPLAIGVWRVLRNEVKST